MYKVIDKKFTLFTSLKKNNAQYKAKIKIAYKVVVSVNKTEYILMLTYDTINGFEFLSLEDIFLFKNSTYKVMSQRVLNTKYRTHPFYDEIKYNMIDLYDDLFTYEDTKIILKKDSLIKILAPEFNNTINNNLKQYTDIVFTKYQLPVEINHRGKVTQVKEDVNLIEFIERYAFGHRQLLLFGEKGTGKTYTIRKFVDKNNWQLLKIDGHAGLDEYSLLGHLIRNENGSFSWKNGSLAQAFREASKGKRVVVFIDEILRMSPQTLNLLITAMDPYNGYYELELDSPKKNKNSDYISTETLKAPTQNLWFICATNIGANYEVGAMDEAFKDRFILKEMQISLDEMRIIIEQKLLDKNIQYSAKKIMIFYGKIHSLYLSKVISHDINLRHLTDVIEYANKPEDLKILFKDKIFAWVGLNYNGEPIKDEITIINNAIDKLL